MKNSKNFEEGTRAGRQAWTKYWNKLAKESGFCCNVAQAYGQICDCVIFKPKLRYNYLYGKWENSV